MSDAAKKEFTRQLADVYERVAAEKEIEASIIEAAKERGIDVASMKKVAREMVMDSEKLEKRYKAEGQLDMFRAAVGIFSLKGLDDTAKAGAAHRELGHRNVIESARALDEVLGSNLAGDAERMKKAVTRKIVRDRETKAEPVA